MTTEKAPRRRQRSPRTKAAIAAGVIALVGGFAYANTLTANALTGPCVVAACGAQPVPESPAPSNQTQIAPLTGSGSDAAAARADAENSCKGIGGTIKDFTREYSEQGEDGLTFFADAECEF